MIVKVEVKPRFVSTLVLLGLVVVAFAGMGWAGYVGDLSEAYLTPPFSPYSYVIGRYNSTHYYLQNGTGFGYSQYEGYQYMSTNASKLIMHGATANVTFFFKVGQYAINNLIPINKSGIQFIGENWGTQITIGTSGGFNISSTSTLRNIHYENLWFDGATTAIRLITSAMPNNTRIDSFMFTHNRVNDFRGTNAIGLNMCNLENSEISYNTWYRTGKTHIQLVSSLYDMGNIRIFGNEFYYGYDTTHESAVRVITKHKGAYGIIQGVFSSQNHYYALNQPTSYSWNITASEGAIAGVQLDNERLERGGLIWTKANATYNVLDLKIIGCRLRNTLAGGVLLNLGVYTKNVTIMGSYFESSGVGSYVLKDNSTSTNSRNQFLNNIVSEVVSGFLPSPTMHVYGNTGLEAYYTVKTNGTSMVRYGAGASRIANFGATTNYIANNTIYIVESSDVYLNITGTALNILIYDSAGTQIASLGTSVSGYRISRGMKFSIASEDLLVVKFLWVQ